MDINGKDGDYEAALHPTRTIIPRPPSNLPIASGEGSRRGCTGATGGVLRTSGLDRSAATGRRAVVPKRIQNVSEYIQYLASGDIQ